MPNKSTKVSIMTKACIHIKKTVHHIHSKYSHTNMHYTIIYTHIYIKYIIILTLQMLSASQHPHISPSIYIYININMKNTLHCTL